MVAASTDVEKNVEQCAFGPRMPARAESLVSQLRELEGEELARIRQLMVSLDLPERMARRAAEIASFNPQSAIRLVNAMRRLFSYYQIDRALESAGYLHTQAERAKRHRIGGNTKLAELIEAHIYELTGSEIAD